LFVFCLHYFNRESAKARKGESAKDKQQIGVCFILISLFRVFALSRFRDPACPLPPLFNRESAKGRKRERQTTDWHSFHPYFFISRFRTFAFLRSRWSFASIILIAKARKGENAKDKQQIGIRFIPISLFRVFALSRFRDPACLFPPLF
jgi:hypothetical protein